MSSILEVKGLKKHFSNQKAVDDISFAIAPGKIYGLLGPNGAGKTTLIRMITGIFYPDEGTIQFEGKRFSPEDDAIKIGYMPEERGLYKKMKVGEQAMYLAQLKGLPKAKAEAAIKEWFVRMEMESWWNKKVEDLSKGMGQKLQFVTTVLHQPKLIILDEPFSGLDPVNSNLIKDEIYRIAKEGSTIIFSTHRMEQVEEICDDIILVNKGQKVLEGEVHEVKQRYKEHLFRISTAQAESVETNNIFEVVGQQANQMVIKLHDGIDNNTVLRHFIDQGIQIESFAEILPSLNDIFLKIVEGTPTARQFEWN